MARVFLTICVLALGLTVAWAGAEARAEQAKADSPSVVTLRTVFTGTCQEIHRYAESLVGTSVIRSAAEVKRGGAPRDNALFLLAPESGFELLKCGGLTSLFSQYSRSVLNCTRLLILKAPTFLFNLSPPITSPSTHAFPSMCSLT